MYGREGLGPRRGSRVFVRGQHKPHRIRTPSLSSDYLLDSATVLSDPSLLCENRFGEQKVGGMSAGRCDDRD